MLHRKGVSKLAVCAAMGFLKFGDVLRIDQFMVHGGNRVLPEQLLAGNFRAKVTCPRPHVAMG